MAAVIKLFEIGEKLMGIYEYNDPPKILYYLSKYLNFVAPYVMHFVTDQMGAELDDSRFHVLLRKFPSGTSIRIYQHWMQLTRVNKFQKFDYGSKELNLKYYN